MPTARAIAVGTPALSIQIAETHWQTLNAGKQAFEANTNLQSQVHLLIRLWERQTVINISKAQFTHQPCWYSCVCQNKWMSRQSSWVEWNPKSAVSEQFIRRPCHRLPKGTSATSSSSHHACCLTLSIPWDYQGPGKSHCQRCDAQNFRASPVYW